MVFRTRRAPRAHRRRLPSAAAALLAALVLPAIAALAPAAATESPVATTAPPPIMATLADGTQGIATTLAPGEESMHDLLVRNTTEDRVLTIAVRAVDPPTDAGEPLDLGAEPTGAALWVHPQVTELRLAPGEEQMVPVQVLVPPDATSSALAAVALIVTTASDTGGAIVTDTVGQSISIGAVITVDPAATPTTSTVTIGSRAVPTTDANRGRAADDPATDPDDRASDHWLWYTAAVALIAVGLGLRWAARRR